MKRPTRFSKLMTSTQSRFQFFPSIRSSNPSPINQIIEISDSQNLSPDACILNFDHFQKNCNKVEKNKNRDISKIMNSSSLMRLTQLIKNSENRDLLSKSLKKRRKTDKFERCGRKQVREMMIKSPYSRFKLMELHSIYNTLINYSDKEPSRFLKGFEATLNYQRINIKPELLKKHVLESKDLSFQSFVNVYKKVEDLMFIQNVVDYIQILFQSNGSRSMVYEDIKEIFGKRCSSEKAEQISTELFERINRGKVGKISISEIYNLCEQDFHFCGKLAQLYHRQIKENTRR